MVLAPCYYGTPPDLDSRAEVKSWIVQRSIQVSVLVIVPGKYFPWKPTWFNTRKSTSILNSHKIMHFRWNLEMLTYHCLKVKWLKQRLRYLFTIHAIWFRIFHNPFPIYTVTQHASVNIGMVNCHQKNLWRYVLVWFWFLGS